MQKAPITRLRRWNGLGHWRALMPMPVLRRAQLARAPLSWHLDARLLRDATILWPAQYDWPHAHKWMESLRQGFIAHLPVVETDNLPRANGRHTVTLGLRSAGKEQLLCIDYSDCQAIDQTAALTSLCYFKMQFRNAGYELASVIPGGFVCNDLSLYHHAARIRQTPRAERFELYGRFSREFNPELRAYAFDTLIRQKAFGFEGTLQKIRYSKSLEEAYQAMLCLDLPGNGGFCFRLTDYLALGCAILAPVHENQLHVPLEPGRDIVFCNPNLSDLVEVAAKTLQNPPLLASLRENARSYFDRYLHQEQLAAYYLHQCFIRL